MAKTVGKVVEFAVLVVVTNAMSVDFEPGNDAPYFFRKYLYSNEELNI